MSTQTPIELTPEELQIINDWLRDPQIASFSRAAAEVIERLLKETTNE